jgi:hypothetical protein
MICIVIHATAVCANFPGVGFGNWHVGKTLGGGHCVGTYWNRFDGTKGSFRSCARRRGFDERGRVFVRIELGHGNARDVANGPIVAIKV